MSQEIKPVVAREEVFDKLEIRVGRVVDVEMEPSAPNPSYKMLIDFSKFGRRVSAGRFTRHPVEEAEGRLVLGVLNFKPKPIGNLVSEVLVLGGAVPEGRQR